MKIIIVNLLCYVQYSKLLFSELMQLYTLVQVILIECSSHMVLSLVLLFAIVTFINAFIIKLTM